MSANQQPFPGAVDTAPANLRHAGRMPRWAVRSSTIAGFLTQRVAGHDDIYVPLATTALAGAQSAADKAKLDALQVPVSRLVYVANTDVLNGAAITAATWTDIHANQNFTVSSPASWLAIQLRLGLHVTAAAVSSIAARANIDSAGTPGLVNFAAGIVPVAAGWGALAGGLFFVNGLATGTHTIKMQLWSDQAATAYCRANTQPNIEWATILVLENNP